MPPARPPMNPTVPSTARRPKRHYSASTEQMKKYIVEKLLPVCGRPLCVRVVCAGSIRSRQVCAGVCVRVCCHVSAGRAWWGRGVGWGACGVRQAGHFSSRAISRRLRAGRHCRAYGRLHTSFSDAVISSMVAAPYANTIPTRLPEMCSATAFTPPASHLPTCAQPCSMHLQVGPCCAEVRRGVGWVICQPVKGSFSASGKGSVCACKKYFSHGACVTHTI